MSCGCESSALIHMILASSPGNPEFGRWKVSELMIGIALNHRKAEELEQHEAGQPMPGDFTEAVILIPPDTLREVREASQPFMTALFQVVKLAHARGYFRSPKIGELVLRTGLELKDLSDEYLEDAKHIGRAWDGFACLGKKGSRETATFFTFIDHTPDENSEKMMYVRVGMVEGRNIQHEEEDETVIKLWFPAIVPKDFAGLVAKIDEEKKIAERMSTHVRNRIVRTIESALGVATKTSGWVLNMGIDPSKIRPVYLDRQSCIAFLSGTKDTGFIYIYVDGNDKTAGLIHSSLNINEGYVGVERYVRFWDILNFIQRHQPDHPDDSNIFRISPFDFHIPRNGNGHR